MQDATAQMALLQFMTAGLPHGRGADARCTATTSSRRASAPTPTCKSALDVNSEVYEFLRTVSAKYGIGFWKPGSGIIHQVVLEQYAFPGGMMIGTDSHTPNAGGLGMVAIGVGGADAVDVMAGWPFNTRVPKLIGVHLTGALSGWAAAKDVILKVAGILTVKGGTGAIVEYFGPGAESISATGKATICNMGAEIGATCSLFPYDARTAAYLKATGREALADLADAHAEHLRIDPEVDRRPRALLRPGHRHRPRRARAAPRRSAHARPRPPDLRRRGARRARRATRSTSATRSSGRAPTRRTRTSGAPRTSRARRRPRGCTVKTPLLITPGSEQVRATIERDGLLADLEAIGATVLANACGPCIGQWQRDDIAEGRDATRSCRRSTATSRPATTATPRRCRSSARPRRSPRWRSPVGSTSTSCASRSSRPTAPRCSSSRPSADELPAKGFDPGESGFQSRRPPTASTVEVVVAARLRAARAARAVPGVGRQRLHRAAGADEGGGQVHHRPHLAGRPVAAVPRPPHQHLAATCSSA